MLEKTYSRPDLFLLLSLLAVILMHPVLDHGGIRRLMLAALMFVPVIVATVRLAEAKQWVGPAVLLALGIIVASGASVIWANQALLITKWGLLAVFFGMTVARLFPYLRSVRVVTNSHLYTAISIYLLLGLLWFALYSVIDAIDPRAIVASNASPDNRQSELLYFSLITLTTIGYGDVLPVHGEARMLAALEGITGVLYVAITVAALVGAYKQPSGSD
jgi:hypothetical protein